MIDKYNEAVFLQMTRKHSNAFLSSPNGENKDENGIFTIYMNYYSIYVQFLWFVFAAGLQNYLQDESVLST